MIVSRGLVGPKMCLNLTRQKGNRLIFLYSCNTKPTLGANADNTIVLLKLIALRRTVTVRNSVTGDDASSATPGAHEKGLHEPYQDPTQVPLVKKTKACRHTVAKGIRQISSVTSG